MSAADYYGTVQKIYIAYYGRAADPEGLEYWAGRLDEASGNLNEIIEAFASSTESEMLFESSTDEDKVVVIYQQLFNRDPDPDGLAFYTEKLQSGDMSQATIMLNVLDGAINEDAEIVENKLTAATAFTEQLVEDDIVDLYAGDLAASQARDWLSTVDDTDESLEEATNQLPEKTEHLGTETLITVGNITVSESDSSVTLEFVRSGNLSLETHLSYSTESDGIQNDDNFESENASDNTENGAATDNAQATDEDQTTNVSLATVGVDYTAVSGTLVFAADETVKTVQITLTDDDLREGTESINLLLSDLVNGTTDSSSIVITLTDDDTLAFNDDTFNPLMNEDEVLIGSVQTINLAEEASVSYSLETPAENGTVTINPDGSYEYVPSEDYHGSDSFQVMALVTLADNTVTEHLLTVNTSVESVNDLPVFDAEFITIETLANTEFEGSISATDIDSEALSYSLDTDASQGTVQVNTDGSYIYTPNADYFGEDSFSVIVSDDVGGTDIIDIAVNVVDTSTDITVSNITVNESDSTVTLEIVRSGYLQHESSLSYTTENGSDNGDGLAVNGAIAGADYTASNGDLLFAVGETVKTIQVSLINDDQLEGTESFNLQLSNLVNATTASPSVVITVADDDVPIFNDETFSPSINEDEVLTGTVQATGLSEGMTVSYSLGAQIEGLAEEQTENGTVIVNADGSYEYTPNADYNGMDSFQVVARTFLAGSEITETLLDLNITVGAVNDVPEFTSDFIALETPVNTNIEATVTATDVDADNLTYSLDTEASNGSVQVNTDGSYVYTPDVDYFGVDGFSIAVADGAGGSDIIDVSVAVVDTSTQITVSNITVSESDNTVTLDIVRSGYLQHETSLSYSTEDGTDGGTNSADTNSPSATEGEDYTANNGDLLFTTGETVKVIEIALTDDNLLEGNESFNLRLTNLINGTLVNSSFSDTTEYDTVVITLTDDDVAEFNEETFSPSVNEDEVLTGTVQTTNLSDEVVASYSLTTQAQNGTVSVNTDGSYEYTPNGNYNGDDSFQVTVSTSREGGTISESLLTLNVTVDPINDAPVFALDAVAIETKANTEIFGTVDATDADVENLNYSLETEASHGSVQVNADGGYVYTPDADYFGADNFSLQVTDAAGGSDIVDIAVTVIDTFTEITISHVVVSENDNSVTLDIARSGYLQHETSFQYSTEGLTATSGADYTGIDGDLSFDAGETVKTLVIELIDDDLLEGTESFNFLISNLVNAATDSNSITITLTDNDTAQYNTETFNPVINEDNVLTGAVQASNLAEAVTVSYSLETQAQNGTVTIDADGDYEYTPNAEFNGSDSFQIIAVTSTGEESLHTLNVTVNAVNDSPEFTSEFITLETMANTEIESSVSATDSDSTDLSYSLDTNAGHGSVQVSTDGSYTYTPDAGYFGTDGFSLQVSDGDGGTDIIDVAVTVIDTISRISVSNIAVSETNNSVSLDIVRSGYLQQESSLSYSTSNGSGSSRAIAGADYTATNGNLTFAVGETVKVVQIILTDDDLHEGTESFKLLLSNLVNATIDSSSVTITLMDNDSPTFNTDSFNPSVNEDEVLTGTIQASDLGSGITVSYSLETQAQNGTVTVDSDGSYEYTPDANYDGNDSFQVAALTSKGTETQLTLNVTVDPVNDAPEFTADFMAIETTVNTLIGDSVSATDIDSSHLTYSLDTDANHGNVQMATDGSYTYTPDNDYTGADGFSIAVSDGTGGTDMIDVSITVIDVESQITVGNITISESNGTAVLDIIRSGYLQHETSLSYTTENGSGGSRATAGADYTATNGNLMFAVGETVKTVQISLTDDSLLEGSESFNLLLSNLVNGTTNTASVTITLTDSDAPTFNSESFSPSVNEDEVLTGAVQATNLANGITASYSLQTQAQNGTVTVDTDGSYEYTPNAHYNGSDSFQITALTSEGTETQLSLNITVDPVNDAPTFSTDSVAIETMEDTEVSDSVSATDIDTVSLTYSLETAASHGSVQVETDGTYTYTPTLGYTGSDVFSIEVADAAGGTDIIDVAVTINTDISAAQFSRIETGIDTSGMLALGDTPSVSLESGEYWSTNDLTYSFNQSIPDSYNSIIGLDLTGWTAFSSAAEAATEDVISGVEAFTDLNFTEDTSGNGDIRFNAVTLTDSGGFAYYPSLNEIGGDVFLDASKLSAADYQEGTDSYRALIHELGHALGLKHPFEDGNELAGDLDNDDYTAMTYTESKNLLLTLDYDGENLNGISYDWDAMSPMYSLLDVAALQAIYGANESSNTGNNSYSLSFDDHSYLTIWDGGGEDTINVSTATGSNDIDLRYGQLSSIDVKTVEEQKAETLVWLADNGLSGYSNSVGGVYDSKADELYTGENNLAIAYGVWIENVFTGSGDDIIYDNAIDNNIQTGAGDDWIKLFEGGFDIVDGGTGDDTIQLNVASTQVSVESINGGGYQLIGDSFAAEIVGIETLSFTDTDMVLA